MLAIAMVVSGLYIVTPDTSEVKAADITQSRSDALEPNVVADGMLNVKMQIQTNQSGGKYAEGSVNLRLVSSVNGLGYKNVGFEVSLDLNKDGDFEDENEFTKFTTGDVSKRINALVTGVTYNYSPKVIDTDAEYFVSGTLMGINKDHLSKDMYVRAFCTTMAGDVVYGTGRYFNITDATAEDIINIPVAMDAAPVTDENNQITGVDVTLGGTTTTATLEKYIDGYAHVNVAVPSSLGDDKTALPSASKVEVGTANAIYRNLESDYEGEGTEDTSWYDEYIAANSGETEFVIATAADLYGLSTLSQSNDFADKTIYMVADIDANEGTASATGFVRTDGETAYSWVPIGKRIAGGARESFVGTLDGGNHTISGLSVSQTGDIQGAWGLFGITGDCVVRNLTITNSSFYFDTTQQMQLGCIAGQSTGTIDTVKVTENVYLTHISDNGAEVTGGIVGQMTGLVGTTNVTGDKTITNCWFAGMITAKSTVGGILGKTYYTQLSDATTIEHCLNTGSVVLNGNSSSGVGGLCGYIEESKLILSDSLNASELDKTLASTFSYWGSAVGYIRYALNRDTTSAVATINNTYAIGEDGGWTRFASLSSLGKYSLDGVVTEGKSGGTIDQSYCMSTDSLIDETGYVKMNLDFTIEDDYAGYWTATTSTPVLSSFLAKETTVDVKEITTPRKAWCVPGTYATTNTYTLYTKADMYGFAELSADDVPGVADNFANKTVILGADITMNDGTVADWEAVSYSNLQEWTARDFAGTFDGENHTIQGVYLDSETGNAGLFATVSGVVRNLRLRNSYFNCTNATTAPTQESKVYTAPIGSIAGTLSGTLDTVYSDGIVSHKGAYAGGLVGVITSVGTDNMITNCCYAGSVTGNSGVGGILGLVVDTNATIEHCLNTGLIIGGTSSGGLCGYVWNTNVSTSPKLTLTDSLNVGKQELTVSTYTYTGSAVGYVRNAYGTAYPCVDADNTYALGGEEDDSIKNWELFAYGSTRGQTTVDGFAAHTGNVYYNLCSMDNIINRTTNDGNEMNLSFYEDGLGSSSDGEIKTCWWIDEEGQFPMLESFADLLRITAE